MYRIIFLTLSVALSSTKIFSQTSSSLELLLPHSISMDVKADMASLLGKYTGKSWRVVASENEVKNGIILKIANSQSFTTKESFRLQSNGTDRLTISSSSTEGLIFGFYKHLRQLGFRFYLPDEAYTIIPKISNPFGPKKDIVDKPFLQIRNFFGTGGVGSGNSDPDMIIQKDWNLWKLRNGFGAAYQLAGHRGEDFILENYELLKKHPNWLASPITGNRHADMLIKLNYSNQEAVDYYVKWSLKPLTQPGVTLPPASHTEFISIEPSDGGGYANELPNAPASLPSISDQVYRTANLAAKKLDQLFPNHPNLGVNLYAYSSHAAPPSFPLHPRVFVQLVPYQFQNIAFGPSFINLWASKLKRFGIYDYLNYPDAQFDLPGGLTIDEAMNRLVHSVRHGSEGTNYESSYSKFATGIPLWLLGRYMTDGDADWNKNLQLLTKELYGTSSSRIFELFQMFYNEPSYNPNYLGNAAKLVKEASDLAKETAIKKRLEELKIYLEFTHLVYESRDVKKGTLYQRLIPVAEYAWKIYPQKIVHSYRIMQLVSYAFLNIDKADKEYARYQKLHLDWFPETPKNQTAWSKIPQGVSASEINSKFQTITKKFQPIGLASAYQFTEVLPLIQNSFEAKKTVIFGGNPSARGTLGVFAPKPTTLTIRYKVEGQNPQLTFSSVDTKYTQDTVVVEKKNSGSFTLKLPAGETTIFINAGAGTTYRLQADISNGFYFFDGAPRGNVAFYKSFTDPLEKYTYHPSFYPSYIYVPRNQTSIDYKVQLNALLITSPSGKQINSELLVNEDGGFEIRRFKLQPSESARIWKAEITGNFNYRFLTIPDRFLLLEKKQ